MAEGPSCLSCSAQPHLGPRHLALGITATVLTQDRYAAAAALWQLKRLWVRIAINAFGTGYYSLACLRRFPNDMLEVAREFVDGLGRDAKDVMTRAIVEPGDTLGLLTVAEGIDTTEQQDHAAALGCDIAQDYLLSGPYRPTCRWSSSTAGHVPSPRYS
jgi:EAL domain-containing protein (putative c-di-GMP-specific phosphodiesterase class I)